MVTTQRELRDITDELSAQVEVVDRWDILDTPKSDGRVLSGRQKVGACAMLLIIAAGLVDAPLTTVVVLNTAFVLFFCATNVMKLWLANRALRTSSEISVTEEELAAVGQRAGTLPPVFAKLGESSDRRETNDAQLPVYTILLPVYREAAVLDQLVRGISALDYPHDCLDVKLIIEEDDTETRDAVAEMRVPEYFDVLIVPTAAVKGKPRACNYGLARARGKFLVIYDAEDRPEPDQLRKSVCAFDRVDDEVVCLQAKLNYFNRSHNVLTRWFTAEYSVWFDQLLPGLQSAEVAIPLGGTSNHFVTSRLVELGGWDALNVTEDADLGLRIFLERWKTAILDTTTYEEATSRCGNWIRQRSRWVKGYMQTYLMHMRRPFRLFRAMGPKAFVAFQLFFGGCTIALLLNPLYWALTCLWFATHLHLIEIAFPRPVLYAGTLGLFVGNAACVLLAVSGSFGRRNYDDVKWSFLAPIYWLLMSVAAYKALWQLFRKPSYWEKTEHGFCRYDDVDTGRTPRMITAPLQQQGQ